MTIPHVFTPRGETREIWVHEINASESTCLYPMSFAFDLQQLKGSIKEVGIVNPPILRSENDHFRIITGLRRIMASRDLGFEKIWCRILRAEDLAPKDALMIALHENLASRQFNIVEKALILKHLSQHYSAEKICNNFMKILGLAKRIELYHLYRDIEQKLSVCVKESLARGALQLKTATLLLTINQKDADILVYLGNKLKLNINQFHEFIDIIIDLSHMHEESVQKILLRPEIVEIIDNDKINIPQKAHKLLEVLREIRYPTVAQAQRRMRQRIESLHLPDAVRLTLPSFLESSEYKLEVLFQDGKQLQRLLKDILKKPGLESIRSPLAEVMKPEPIRESNEI